MPPKQVTCSICGEVVNKKQTLMLSDGTRACRSHDGVQKDSDDRIQGEKDRERRKTERIRKNREVRRKVHENPLQPRCMSCGSDKVMPARDFYMRALIEMEKYKEIHNDTPNPFNPEYAQKIFSKLKGIHPLIYVPKDKNPDLRKHLLSDYKVSVDLINGAWVCQKCIIDHGLKDMMDDVDFKAMMLIGNAGFAALRPDIHKRAVQEIIRDN